MSPIKMHTRYALRAVKSDDMPQLFRERLASLEDPKRLYTYDSREEALKDRNWQLGLLRVRDLGAYPDMLEVYEVLTYSEALLPRLKVAWDLTWDKEQDDSPDSLGVMATLGVVVGAVIAVVCGIALLTGTPFTWGGFAAAVTFPVLAIGADVVLLVSTLMWHLPKGKERPFTAEGMFAGMGQLHV